MRMKITVTVGLFLLGFLPSAFSQQPAIGAEQNLVAYWSFDEGSGGVLHDRSPNANHGNIKGAKWLKAGRGFALSFDGENDYVDCGNGASLDITGPITLQAWVQPTAVNRGEPGIVGKFFESYAITYYKGKPYWYISSGGNNVNGPIKIGAWTHIAATFDGTTMRIYFNGEEAQTKKSKFSKINHGNNFLMGCIVSDPTPDNRTLRDTAFFQGLIDSVRVHNRALSWKEILHYYNLEAEEKGQKPFDTSKLGRLALEPFYYPDAGRAVLSVNFRWVLPLAEDAKLVAELAAVGNAVVGHPVEDDALQSRQLNLQAPRNEDEAEFSLKGLKPGMYELRAVLRTAKGAEKTERVQFRYPFAPLPPVASPEKKVIAPLPPPVTAPPYKIELGKGGGFKVTVKDNSYRVESSYSYPYGGQNRLLTAGPDKNGERFWKVTTRKLDGNTYQVTAGGKYYSITRRINLEPTRIMVKDTIHNTSDDVVGIILSNHINLADAEDVKVIMMNNLTVFAHAKDNGVGLIALDDLYQLQQNHRFSNGLAELRTEDFGLDKGASYTVEWAVYPTATNDYYDFINQVRKDEGLNRRIEGSFAFVPRRTPPTREFMQLLNLKYTSIGCLGHPPDDPNVSLEGFEFMKYPEECALLKQTFAETKKMYPGVKVMFHVAHGLYATNKPNELFPDSRALDSNGNQIHYGPNTMDYYGRYFSKERVNQGWRWWIFYPTMNNSYGKAMLEAMRYMVDELGATGMWADGFVSGYVPGGYSYDRWDGHSVTIDPDTKLVTRRKNCVPYVSLPVLKEVARIIGDKGGVVITNGHPGSRSLWKENMISSCEGSQRAVIALHLGPVLASLSSSADSVRSSYRDILTKLEYGSLYFWYRYKMDHKTLVEYMYPITVESIHPGTVRGKERIITTRSGVYGWQGDNSLHIVYLYDARGELTRSSFITTVDNTGVRTELPLKQDQSAAVVKLPITLTASAPVNVNVRQYDADAIRMVLNGRGTSQICVANGDFPICAASVYRLVVGGKSTIIAGGRKDLSFSIDLDGKLEVTIHKLDKNSNIEDKQVGEKRDVPGDFDVISDGEFFNALDLSYPGLEKVKLAVRNEDLKKAKAELVSYFQKREKPVVVSGRVAPKDNPAAIDKKGEKICEGYIEAYQMAYAGKDIDWFNFPMTDPGARMQSTLVMVMNFHSSTENVAKAYFRTANHKYARRCVDLILDWIRDMKPFPKKPPTGRKGMMWRTVYYTTPRITSWINSYFYIRDCPSISVDERITILKAILEHIRYIRENEVPNMPNMLVNQLNRLLGYGLLLPEFKESKDWIETAVQKSYRLLDDYFYPDGAYIELAYFGSVYPSFVNVIRLAEKHNINLPADFARKLECRFEFPMYMYKPNGLYPSVNDTYRVGDPVGFPPKKDDGVLKAGADLFDRDDMRYVATYGREGKEPRYKSYAFGYGGFYVMRSDFSKDARYLVFDGGKNAGGHNHLDKLSFELYAYGNTLVTDTGCGGPWGSDFRSEYFVGTAGQNTIMVDGKGQVGNYPLFDIPSTMGNTPWRAVTTKPLDNTWLTSENFDYVASRYEDGYGNRGSEMLRDNYIDYESSRTDDPKRKAELEAKRYPHIKPENRLKVVHRRSILFVKPDYWIMSDLLTGEGNPVPEAVQGKHTIDAMFHFVPTADYEIDKPRNLVTTTNGSAALIIHPSTESNLSVDIISGKMNPIQGWVPGKTWGQHQPAPVAVYTSKDNLPVAIDTVLYPYPKEKSPELSVTKLEVKEEGRKLAQAQASGLAIKIDGATDFYLISYTKPSRKEFGNITFDGEVALIRNKDKNIWRLVMIKAAELMLGKKMLVKAQAPLEYLDVEYKDDIIKLTYKPENVAVKLFTQGRKKAIANGRQLDIPAGRQYINLN